MRKKYSFDEFFEVALEGSGVQNDENDVWIEVDGVTYFSTVFSVLGRCENFPFEASGFLESHRSSSVWLDFYDDYLKDF